MSSAPASSSFALLLWDAAAFALVGMLWGCTNPLLKKGSEEQRQRQEAVDGGGTVRKKKADEEQSSQSSSFSRSLLRSLSQFRRFRVWGPYVLNQLGSLVFYFAALSKSDLSSAVPICNALALVFSVLTSHYLLGERVDRPIRAFFGAALVVGGVATCLLSKQRQREEQEDGGGCLASLSKGREKK